MDCWAPAPEALIGISNLSRYHWMLLVQGSHFENPGSPTNCNSRQTKGSKGSDQRGAVKIRERAHQAEEGA